MSHSMEIFVEPVTPFENLAQSLEALLEIKLDRLSDEKGTKYEYHNSQVHLALWEHNLENDRDMDFEHYQYQLSVWGINDNDPDKCKKLREDFSHFIFQRLKATQSYHLMLIDDLQIKLDEFHPV